MSAETEGGAPAQAALDALTGPDAAVANETDVTSRTGMESVSGGASDATQEARDLADVSAVELITTVGVHLLSAAALRCGLAEDGDEYKDLDEARSIINALAGLVTAAAPDLGDTHARALRDGLRSVQLAFREASDFPDAPGEGPGEKYTGAVS